MNFKNRKEQIQFLKEVLDGKNKITNLIPKSWETFINSGENPKQFKCPGSTNEFLTRDQINEYKKKYQWKNIIIMNLVHSDIEDEKDNNSIDISLSFNKPVND